MFSEVPRLRRSLPHPKSEESWINAFPTPPHKKSSIIQLFYSHVERAVLKGLRKRSENPPWPTEVVEGILCFKKINLGRSKHSLGILSQLKSAVIMKVIWTINATRIAARVQDATLSSLSLSL